MNEYARRSAGLMVVRSTPWKTHAYDPETGTLSEEWMRGLSVIFAKGFGEGMNATPLLHYLRGFLKAGQDDSPPDDPVAWNNRAHFLALAWAARNKVRHSVRWKTGARVRRARKLEALRRVKATAQLIQRRAEGRAGIQARMADRTAKGRREAAREIEAERFHDRLREIAPAPWEDDPARYFTNGWDEDQLSGLEFVLSGLRALPGHIEEVVKGHAHNPADRGVMGDALALACLLKDRRALRAIASIVKARRASLSVTLALRALESAAYRAHLTRRVRPPVRRSRAPRPLYARPRPPTAPLAPPVA